MGWFRKKKGNAVVAPPDDQNLWVICPSCKAHIFREEWDNRIRVCPKCNFHDRITYEERLSLLLDAGTFREMNSGIAASDPLKFVDPKGSYADKVAAAKLQTGMNEAVITGRGRLHGTKVTIAIMDFRFMGGSLGGATGDKIFLAAEYARKNRQPYVIVSASGGARMHEGIVSLMQMAKTCAGIARLHHAGVPYISILTHPTTGGVSASFAMVGDINIAEPGALIGFAGRRVIEETIKQKLPDDFQTAEYLLEHGFIDRIVNRSEMKDFLHKYLQYWNSR
jgi:acetyl-CoA carboxylase carboxyl transferase subunit beta